LVWGLVVSAGGRAAVGSESGRQVLQRPPGVVGWGGWATASPFGTGQTLHLNIATHGGYDTGVFAYHIIRRERYGLRIVGSLKSQPSLNVLAIYEM
jgi:hypothetical protein